MPVSTDTELIDYDILTSNQATNICIERVTHYRDVIDRNARVMHAQVPLHYKHTA